MAETTGEKQARGFKPGQSVNPRRPQSHGAAVAEGEFTPGEGMAAFSNSQWQRR